MPRELGNCTPRHALRKKDLPWSSFEYIRRLACGVCRMHTPSHSTVWDAEPASRSAKIRETHRATPVRRLRRRPLFPSPPPTLSTSTQATRIDFPRAPIISFPRVRLTLQLH